MKKEDANLAISDQVGLVADADAFVSISQAEREFSFGCSGGTEGLDCEIGEIETWIVDSAATRHMTPNPVSMTNYRDCDGVVRVANGVTLPIEGVGDILMSFQSDFGETDLRLLNAAFVPLLSHNVPSLKQFTRRADHSYRGDGDGVTLFCKSGRWFFAPTVWKHDQMRGYRARSEGACAAIVPAVKPPNIDTEVAINEFHCSFGHVHKELLLETAKKRGVTLTGELHECKGCSMAKGRMKPIAKTSKSRADKRGGRVFLDVCGRKSVRPIGGKEYMLLVKDDFLGFLLCTS